MEKGGETLFGECMSLGIRNVGSLYQALYVASILSMPLEEGDWEVNNSKTISECRRSKVTANMGMMSYCILSCSYMGKAAIVCMCQWQQAAVKVSSDIIVNYCSNSTWTMTKVISLKRTLH